MNIKEPTSTQVSAASTGKPDSKSNGIIVSQKASEIKTKPISWIWKDRIARGKISILSGNPGVAKSQLCANFGAIITTGGYFPDKTKCDIGTVIFINGEDDAADKIVPRLVAAGANLELIDIIDHVSKKNQTGIEEICTFSLAKHLKELEQLIVRLGNVVAIFIDPITAYLGNIDANKNSDVRSILSPIAVLAEKYNVAIICISHNNKNNSQEAIHRVIGSIGFIAASRSAFAVVKDPASDKRLFIPLKNNNGNDKTGFAFNVESVSLAGGIETSRVVWLDESITKSADELMSNSSINEDKSALEEAEEFLLSLLSDGPIGAIEIKALAKQESISESTLRRAKQELGIKVRREGFASGSKSYWSLPIDGQDMNTCST